MRLLATSHVLFLSIGALGLAGCDLNADGNASGSSHAAAIHGVLHGGQQPVVGAHLYLFAPNTTGSGGNGLAAASTNASVSLLNSSVATHNPSIYHAPGDHPYLAGCPIHDRQSPRRAGLGGGWRAFPNAAGTRWA